MPINLAKIRHIFIYIALAEALSLIGYFMPAVGVFLFFAILIFFLVACLLDAKYGLYILLAELFISSKGYLFYLDFGGIKFSIRIALFIAFISVWLAQSALAALKERKIESAFSRSSLFPYFIVLFIFIAWGAVNGLLNNSFENMFFDFNGWMYFALIVPAYGIIFDRKTLQGAWSVFFAALAWLSIKTLILVYLFSHEFHFIERVYRWVRDTGVGEITRMEGNLYRIFFQSHIFLIIGFFILALFSASALQKREPFAYKRYLPWLALVSSGVIISLSRSFWLGLFSAVLPMVFAAILIFKKEPGRLLKYFGFLALSGALGVMLIIIAVKFPLPRPFGDFSAGDIGERAMRISNEPGASSRWALLPVLNAAISENPILGKGFGATATYQSSDPRVLIDNPDGRFTTFAFEWGWHDIWFKTGFFGWLSYISILLLILTKLFSAGLKPEKTKAGESRCGAGFCSKIAEMLESLSRLGRLAGFGRRLQAPDSLFAAGLALGLIAISVVNIFSPYLNHPLGIGMVILSAITAERLKDSA